MCRNVECSVHVLKINCIFILPLSYRVFDVIDESNKNKAHRATKQSQQISEIGKTNESDNFQTLPEPTKLAINNLESTGPSSVALELRDVRFVYASRSELPVLRGLSMSVTRGGITAICGRYDYCRNINDDDYVMT